MKYVTCHYNKKIKNKKIKKIKKNLTLVNRYIN